MVMFIFRDEYYNPDDTDRPGEADLIIAKNRSGPICLVKAWASVEHNAIRDLPGERPQWGFG